VSLGERLRRWFGGRATPAEEAPGETAALPAAAPESPRRSATWKEEEWLAQAVTQAAEGKATPPAELWPRLDALVAEGHERLAIEWLDKLARAHTQVAVDFAAELSWRAALRRADRGELREVLDVLEALATQPVHAARASFLLADFHRREGDLRRALYHLEAVLALDVDFPNARVRAQAIRAELGGQAAAPSAQGDTIVGVEGGGVRSARYQLVRQLGRGSSGVVYLARDVELEREVAVKLLHPHLAAAATADARARFFSEARVAAALRHPGIIAILDLDESERRIVMEHAAGGTLRQRLGAGPLAPLEALERHVELCSALAAAHARGVVHRDLKPANLLFRRDGGESELVLTDFGVAHLAGADRRASGREPVGTLAYMAPEQRRGGDATPAADVWAAGVILWECLTGRLPWSQEALFAGRRVEGELALPPQTFAALGTLGPGVAEGVSQHLLALGAVEASGRPDATSALTSARALVDAIRHGDELRRYAQELASFRT
jgi:tetratricopeptide (TPR) repeat protein